MDIVSEVTEKGVTERQFELKVGDEVVPGIWWGPEGATTPSPTILIGHGGTSHKRVPYVLGLARRFARHQGWNSVAIDAPGHGDRVADQATAEVGRERLAARIAEGQREGRTVGLDPSALKAMAAWMRQAVPEWKAVLDDIQSVPQLTGPYGYWGLSMGTSIGLPFVVSEPRIACAVLGLNGVRPDYPGGSEVEQSARSLNIPVLLVLQSEDELVCREAGMAMWDAFASKDKALHIHPGGHVGTPLYERDIYELFFARHLNAAS